MKKEDLSKFKGEIKGAVQEWAEGKIDMLFGKHSAAKTLVKKGLNNILVQHDANINKWLDGSFLFLANEKGVIDSDEMIDTFANLLKEMDVQEYHFGVIDAVVGKGEAVISMPRNFLFDLLGGNIGSVKFTTDDIIELKELLNN